MPWKSPRCCLQPYCPELVPAGKGYCDKHYPGWEESQRVFLAGCPDCYDCKKIGLFTKSTVAHRVIPLAEGGTDWWPNLIALCDSCHEKRNADDVIRCLSQT